MFLKNSICRFILPAIAAFIFNINYSLATEMRAPDEIELKAAYCISVLQHLRGLETAIQQGDVPEKVAQDISNKAKGTADKLNRLQSFLLPRTDYIDTDALSLAHARGQKDLATSDASNKGKECQTRCFPSEMTKEIDKDRISNCYTKCLDEDEVFRRIHSCNTLDFLPY